MLSPPTSLAVFPSRPLSSIVLRLSGGSELLRTRGYSPLFPSVHVQFSLSGRPLSVCIIALIFVFLMRSCLSQSGNFSIQFHSLSLEFVSTSYLFSSSGMALLSCLLFFRLVPFFGEWGEGTWDELLSRVTFIFGCELEGGSPLSSCVLMGTATKLFLFTCYFAYILHYRNFYLYIMIFVNNFSSIILKKLSES